MKTTILVAVAAAAAVATATAGAAVTMPDLSGSWKLVSSTCDSETPGLAQVVQCGDNTVLAPVDETGTLVGVPVYGRVVATPSLVQLSFTSLYGNGTFVQCGAQLTGDMQTAAGECVIGTRACKFEYACSGDSCNAAKRAAPVEGAAGLPVVDGVWSTDPGCECYQAGGNFSPQFSVFQCGASALVVGSNPYQGKNVASVSTAGTVHVGTFPGSTTTCVVNLSSSSSPGSTLAGTCTSPDGTCSVTLNCGRGPCYK